MLWFHVVLAKDLSHTQEELLQVKHVPEHALLLLVEAGAATSLAKEAVVSHKKQAQGECLVNTRQNVMTLARHLA